MNIQVLKKFAEQEHQRLQSYYPFKDPAQVNFPITVKITEELGELCNEVLAHSGLQRKEKLAERKGENLSEEFADVILTTCILAHGMNVDIEVGLKNKMKILKTDYPIGAELRGI